MSTYKKYLKGIHAKFGHFAAWLPDEKLRLGDVGLLDKQGFALKTTLHDLKITFTVRSGDEGEGGDLYHSSGATTSVDFAGEAKVAGAPAGAATVTLGGTGAFLFQALGCTTSLIANMAHVSNELVDAYRDDAFEVGWVVIDRLVTAESATILISGSSSAVVDLSANAPLATMQALADASLGVEMARSSGEVTQYVARARLTPMYRASRLNRSFLGLGAPRVGVVRSGDDQASPAAEGLLEAVPATEWLEEDASR